MGAVKLLLPVDDSHSATRAISLIAGYRGDKSRLAPVLLNVQPPPVMLWPEASLDVAAVERALLEAGREVTQAAARRLPELQPLPEQAVRLGPAAGTILREAETRRSDLIVMGTRVRDPVGVNHAGAYYMVNGVQNDFCDQFMRLATGTTKDGVWKMSCTLPAKVRNGPYEATGYARDTMNNWTNTNGGDTSDVRAHFDIVGGSDDSVGPTFHSIELGRESYVPGETVTLTMHVADPSGVEWVQAGFTVGGRGTDGCSEMLQLISGDVFDGVWSANCEAPARNGTYTVTPYGKDFTGNFTNTNGGATTPLVGSFEVTGGSDDFSGPEVVSLSPNADTYAPGETFVLTLHLRDPSGVEYAGAVFTVDGVQNDFCDQWMTRVSGTLEDGQWELRCKLPTTARVGSYVATPYAKDLVGNYVNVNAGDLSPVRARFDVLP
jgi:nucleotide-binding universal stress UspA family protein